MEKTWLQRRYDSLKALPAVFIDGSLYASWAALTALLGIFSGEESYKYVNPYALFWMKTVLSTIVAGIGAIKMFRSTAYSDHQEKKKILSGNTESFIKTETIKKEGP
jgi:hypothetical protein